MSVASLVHGAVAEPGHESSQLLHGFLVGLSSLLFTRQFSFTENSCFGVAARPRDECRGTGGKKIHPIERAVLFVEADDAALDLIFPHVVAVEVKIERRLEFARMRATAGKFALAP